MEFKPVSAKQPMIPDPEVENLPRNRFSPSMNNEIIDCTLRLARELELPRKIRTMDPDNKELGSPESDSKVQESESLEMPERDSDWIILTNASRVIKASLSETKQIFWYNSRDSNNQAEWYLAGRRRSAGNIDILRGAPTRTRAYYDPYVAFNTIDRRLFTRYEIGRYATNLPGETPEMGRHSSAIIQMTESGEKSKKGRSH